MRILRPVFWEGFKTRKVVLAKTGMVMTLCEDLVGDSVDAFKYQDWSSKLVHVETVGAVSRR